MRASTVPSASRKETMITFTRYNLPLSSLRWNSTAISYIGKFYLLFASWETTWHCPYPISPKARAKMAGTVNKVYCRYLDLTLRLLHCYSWFKGCVALLRYSSASKPFENAKLQSSLHVLGNCSGEPCSRNQHICLHNGTCVDLITMTECVCETETGYHGRYCEPSGKCLRNPSVIYKFAVWKIKRLKV